MASGATAVRERVAREARRLAGLVVYLAVILGGFRIYTLLVRDEPLSSFVFGYGLLEALILAKVLLIGDLLHLGERRGQGQAEVPLIIPTLQKTLLFSLLIFAFKLLEHIVVGLIHHEDPLEALRREVHNRWDEMLAQIVIIYAALIPLFAVRELSRAMGKGRLAELFFRPKPSRKPEGGSGNQGSSRTESA